MLVISCLLRLYELSNRDYLSSEKPVSARRDIRPHLIILNPTQLWKYHVCPVDLRVRTEAISILITVPRHFHRLPHASLRHCCCCCCCFLTLTDPLRIQPWSQDRRNQTKSNRESEISMESRQKRTDKEVASKGHRRDKIENINKNTQTVETN